MVATPRKFHDIRKLEKERAKRALQCSCVGWSFGSARLSLASPPSGSSARLLSSSACLIGSASPPFSTGLERVLRTTGGALGERETEMSDFARPPKKSRRVQEMARLGRPIGFASWSNEENRERKEKKNRRRKSCCL